MVIAHKHSTSVGLSNQYKNGYYGIRIRVCYNGERTDLYTRLSATKQQWDNNKQRFKHGYVVDGVQYNILNGHIDNYINFVHDYFNKASLREVLPSLSELKKQFNYTFKKSGQTQTDEFFYLFEQYIDTRSETRHWSATYKKMFTRTKNRLKAFMPEIRFTDFTTGLMNEYVQYLAENMKNDKIAKELSMLKEFLTYADKKNYPVNKEFFEYDPTLSQSKKAVRYLTINELQTLINMELDKGSTLDMTRDFFVFQCFTALRFSDLKNLKHENIRITDNGYEIDILTKKDNDRIPFPLSKVATSIYLKYKDNRYDNGVVFPVTSNQKYNKHLKELGRKAGIKGEWTDYQYILDKVVEKKTPKADLVSHSARRTFVVTALNEGIELDLIRQITSHADVEVMRPYIAATIKGKQKVIAALDKAIEE